MAGKAPPRKGPPSPNGAPTLTPLGHYAGRPDIAISRQITVIGSKAGSRLHLASSTVSQSHAIIVNSAAGPYIRDLASRTNVLVNGKPKREADLSDGALLQIGKFKFQFNEGVTNTGLQLGRSTPVGEFDPAPGAVLNVEGGEMPVPIEERTVLIGRRPICDIPLIEESVSTAHAVIFEMNGKRYIRDLNSRTGTFVNDQKVEQVELKFGDQIRIGETNIGYASASGQVAEREVDELDHLVSTAPLGTAALEPPDLTDEAADDEHEHGTAAGHAIPVEADESNDDDARIPVGDTPPREAPAEDQVRLDADPDVGGAGPGDTAVLPPQREAEPKARRIPTLKARLIDEPEPAAAAPAAPAKSASDEADIDDALGLTPEARRREEAKAEDLGGSRRGWRGMAGDETGIPLSEHAAEAPAPHPELEAETETESEAEIPAEVEATPQVELESQPEAEPEPTAAPAAEAAETRDEVEAEEPQDTAVEAVAERALEEPPAPHVEIGEQVTESAADTLPAETFDLDITEDVSPPLASAEHESPQELHLPPVTDETDEFDIEPLPLTPEEGAPLDLSVDETPEPIDRPTPPLKLEEPAPEPAAEAEPQPEPEPVPEKKSKRKRASRKEKRDVEPEPTVEAPAAPAPQPVVESTAEPEPIAEAPAARDSVEVVDETQPTPESALDIEDAVADMLAEPLPLDESPPAAADMTDTGFGRAVDAFVGESTGPLVEEREEPGASSAKAPAKAEPVEEAPELVAEAAEEPKAAEEAPQAPSLDDLIADVLGPDVPGKAEGPSLDAQGDDVAMEELALEELGLPAEATAKAKPAAETEPVSEAQAEEVEVEVEAEPEPEPQSVAQAAQDEQPAAKDQEPPPTPEQEVPSAARPMVAPPGFGPNQEHFLGGMPLKLNKPVKPAGLSDAPGAAAAAARAPNRAPLMPAPPPRATRPNARTRNPFDIAPNDLHTEDLGASIPPYRGNAPKAGQITTGFDGLAMPPVRQTDVFSQMSTPASFVAGLAGGMADDDIFSRGAKHHSPEPQQAAPAARKTPEPSIDARDEAVNEGMHDTEVGSTADAVWTDDAAQNDVASDDAALDDAVGETVGAAGAPPARPRQLPTPPTFGPDGQPAAPAPKRKRRWFGLRLLLVLMLLLSAATAGGIYGFVKRQTNVVGKLRFDNVESLKTIEQSNLLNEQKKLVSDQAVRETARKLLAERNPTIAPGFLADPVAFERAAQRADWAADQKGAFAFPYVGNDEQGDPQRVRAVMLALYDANTKHVGASGSIHASIKSLTDAHAKSQQRVNDLKAQIERLNVVAQQMPERKHLDELTAEVARLDQAYTDARRKAKDINDDLERMRQSLPANPQPAGTAQSPVVDPELSKMQEELDATNKRLADTKAERAKASEAAQVALDAALGQFEKEIAGAQGIAKDNPELSAYVSAAQKLQTSTRELTEQLIRRQQQQQQQLGELKTRLSEKMEARRADAWKKDPKLQEYGDQLAIVQRQYNAAMGGGAKKEAEEFKAQIDMLDKMIKARQTLVGDDAFYADAIDQLQKMIDSSQRSLDDDRKHTEAVLEDMQAAFTKSQPAVEKMPAAQKELAASLEKQLAGVNAARKQYTQAADAAAAAGDEEVKKAQAAAATLAAKIETRRKELASQAEKAATAEQEQNRLAAVKQRESQLVAAQAVELKARQEWDTAQRALREAESTQAEAREAGEKRDALAGERVDAQKNLDAALRKLELARAEAGHVVEPFPPTEADVQMTVHDPRPVYALASVGGIVAVFTLLILFTAGGPAAEPDEMKPGADFPAFAVRTPPTPQPNGNGNGSPAAQHPAHPADEESPRVAV